ncbi:hypothetical protein QYB64_003148 [Clostridium perfringens]|nr:hypothetical protein [Clostridium perfringens]ELC8451576.1 hypothetical protein [Clostridium perfringens]
MIIFRFNVFFKLYFSSTFIYF